MLPETETVFETVQIPNQEALIALFGSFDENMQVLELECGVKIRINDRELTIEGENEHVQIAVIVLTKMLEMIERKESIDKSRVRYAVSLAKEGQAELISQMMSDVILVTHRGKQIKCRTAGQKKYVDAIRKNSIVFAIGPAGTGKTYLAMAMACLAIKNKEVARIVLTRPAVEAGEKLGFLPGDLQNKVDPYLRPLHDALYEMLGQESYARFQEKGVVEVAPMAYMRGRTLNDAFIVLDEAQNTTPEQMKMFLTRLGQGSRMVITGDITQIDLPSGHTSGLIDATNVLNRVPDIEICRLTSKDVVRHELVQSIIEAYERRDNKRRDNRS